MPGMFGSGGSDDIRLLKQIPEGGCHRARGELHSLITNRTATGSDGLPRMRDGSRDEAGCGEAGGRNNP